MRTGIVVFAASVVLLLFIFAGFYSGRKTAALFTPDSDTVVFQLGDRIVLLEKTLYGPSDSVVFINLHDNERTSVRAGQTVLAEKGGFFLRIINDSTRLVNFRLCDKRYSFDPNRIFTEAVGEVVEGHESCRTRAVEQAKQFALFVLQQIPAHAHTVIALHNNHPYSNLDIYTFAKADTSYKDAAGVHINRLRDKDDFFLTNDSMLFRRLCALHYNAMLQNNTQASDDGSLSIYYRDLSKRYVNVETEHDPLAPERNHLAEQVEMLRSLMDMLKEF